MAQYAAPAAARDVDAGTSAGGIVEQAKGAVEDVTREARAAGSSVGGEVRGLGSTIKQGLTDQVERRKNGIADEIRRNDVPGILGSAEVFARRQPALFMGATVALGFALTRFVGAGTAGQEGRESWRDQDWDAPRGAVRGPGPGLSGADPGFAPAAPGSSR